MWHLHRGLQAQHGAQGKPDPHKTAKLAISGDSDGFKHKIVMSAGCLRVLEQL
jgi:hypothetical protein